MDCKLLWPLSMTACDGTYINANRDWWPQQVEIAEALERGVSHIRGYRQSGRTTAILSWVMQKSAEAAVRHAPFRAVFITDLIEVSNSLREKILATVRGLPWDGGISVVTNRDRISVGHVDIAVFVECAPFDVNADRVITDRCGVAHLTEDSYMTRWWEDPVCVYSGSWWLDDSYDSFLHNAELLLKSKHGVTFSEEQKNFVCYMTESLFSNNEYMFLSRYPI